MKNEKSTSNINTLTVILSVTAIAFSITSVILSHNSHNKMKQHAINKCNSYETKEKRQECIETFFGK